jgi:hypothetical protein
MGISDEIVPWDHNPRWRCWYERLGAQEVGVYEVAGVWVAGEAVELDASGSAFGVGEVWLIVDGVNLEVFEGSVTG